MKKYTFENIPNISTVRDEELVVSHDEFCTYEPMHCHDYYEIEYIREGSGVQIINGNVYSAHAGDIFAFNTEDLHSYYSVDNLKIINICISHNLMRKMDLSYFGDNDRVSALSLDIEYKIELETYIYLLEKELETKRNMYDDSKQYILHLIFILFDRCGFVTKPLEERWSNLIKYISENYCTVTLSDVSEYFCVTKNYFCKVFKKKFGISFLDYLNNIKIQKAKFLLTHTDNSIEDIYISIGINQSKQFYKLFRQSTGTTPLKYRKNS